MQSLLSRRFLKFGTVGASGVLINLSILWLCQEWVLRWVQPDALQLNLSLAAAICLSTFNNYFWNRFWTWRDRNPVIAKGFWSQMAEYYTVCWVAIALQVVCTNLLEVFMHYLLANLLAIGLAAIFSFLINDAWTFSRQSLFGWLAALTSRTKGS